MPRFRVRLESPEIMRADGSPEFRVSILSVADEDEARRVLMKREYKICGYELDADTLAEHERTAADAETAGAKAPTDLRAQLCAHRQVTPYEIVSIEEMG